MLDVVSLIASVITIAQAVIEGVNYARTLYRACEELTALQEQLEQLSNLVKELNSQHATSNNTAITNSLSRARFSLEQLDQLIKVKIIKHVNGTARARRRAWARNKSKICKLQEALREHRLNLLAAISGNALSSANRSEMTLNSISRDVNTSKEQSLSIDRQLLEIHHSISRTHHAVLSQTNAIDHVLQSTPSTLKSRLHSQDQYSSLPWRANMRFLQDATERDTSEVRQSTDGTRCLSGSTEDHCNEHKRETIIESSAGFHRFGSKSIISPKPASLFEVSGKFFPETYTTNEQLPISTLLVASCYERSFSVDWRTNFYSILYLNSPRQWRRLNISINITRYSKYWAATMISQNDCSTKHAKYLTGAASIPRSLLIQIQQFCSEAQGLDEDADLHFSLSDSDGALEQDHKSHTCQLQDSGQKDGQSSIASQNILTFLDDLGCPRYFETEITQAALLEQPNIFAACLNGMLVCEIKFTQSLPSQEMLYNIQVLRCMNGVLGFAKLVGIVVDITGKHLKSYLLELPKTVWSLVPEVATQDPFISWERREKWARQLIEGVKQVHSKGFVIGNFWYFRPPVLIDGKDFLHFWRFKANFIVGYTGGCYYPPEFRHLRDVSPFGNGAECFNTTPKTDIFQLGLILWFLAENEPRTRLSPVCMRAGCAQQQGTSCDASHIDPVTLPRLSENVPQYFRDIIDACRARNPHERSAAWRLLELFPPLEDSEIPGNPASRPETLDTLLLNKAFLRNKFCNSCRNPVPETFFHCNICHAGDYDICPICYNGGSHCYDGEHLLVEMEKSGGWPVSGRYHSIIKSSGIRDIMEL